jgi:hypothetical protein
MVGENGKLQPFVSNGNLSREQWIEHQSPVGIDNANASYDLIGRFIEWWTNDIYSVHLNENYREHSFKGCTLWELSVERKDGRSIHDWRDLQAIKNMLAGPEYEAIELYPAEDRVVDRVNQYHLFVIATKEGSDKPPRFPVGCNCSQRVTTGERQRAVAA